MLKKRTVYMAAVLSLFAALPALAAVTPITEYTEKIYSSKENAYIDNFGSATEIDPGCNDGEWLNAPPAGYTCAGRREIIGTGDYCYYGCKCAYTKNCSKTGLKGSGGSCTNNGSTYYKECICADGYVPAEDLKNKEKLNLPASVTGGGITCYKKDGITCKTTYKKSDISESYGVTYTTFKPFDGSSLMCVESVVAGEKCRSNDFGTQYDCFERETVTLLTGDTYYCLTGNCSNSGGCTTTTSTDCFKTSSISLAGITCRNWGGCDVGLEGSGSGQYICGSSAPSGGFAYSALSENGTTCYKVTGCPSGYEKAYMGTPTSKDYSTGNGQTYDVKKYSVSTAVLICRKAQGCSISGQYDINTCWNGCLAWWF